MAKRVKAEKVIPPAHSSCDYFDTFIQSLENERVQKKEVAEKLDCSPETIRKIRLGMVKMDVKVICDLQLHYNANPLFLISGILPMRILPSQLNVVNEAQGWQGHVQ